MNRDSRSKPEGRRLQAPSRSDESAGLQASPEQGSHTTPELLACPFCGKQPRTCPDDSYGAALVFCPDDNECLVQPTATAVLNNGENLAVAIEAWNTRASTPPIADELAGALDSIQSDAEEIWREHDGCCGEVVNLAENILSALGSVRKAAALRTPTAIDERGLIVAALRGNSLFFGMNKHQIADAIEAGAHRIEGDRT